MQAVKRFTKFEQSYRAMCKPPRGLARGRTRREEVIRMALLKTERVAPTLRIAKNG